jgi:hypothetical protein
LAIRARLIAPPIGVKIAAISADTYKGWEFT